MKQILQNLGTGETILAEVASPSRGEGKVLSQSTRTLISLGTEKMLIDFGKGGLISKARSQPDKVKQVLQKIRTDGLWSTLDAVKAKLDTPIPLGYCNVGVVSESDSNSGFSVGDRIISNGPHAEIVSVPINLAAKIPVNVTDEQASFVVVSAIGLQGVRLLAPTLGERIVVSGLGLIGLLSVQILRAHGCQVLGIDFDPKKLELARQFGAETCDLSAEQDPIAVAENWTNGVGVDGVLITASTKSDELIHQAATMCRQRGRVVLIGVTGLSLRRADFYEKEISFQVSCSYGPGRYDDNYEKRGLDYPVGFVRWTEKRNFEAVLQLMADGKINTDPLISHRVPFDHALDAYAAINSPDTMGILLNYNTDADSAKRMPGNASEAEPCDPSTQTVSPPPKGIAAPPIAKNNGLLGTAFIGAGGFTTRTLLPLLPKGQVSLRSIVSGSGVTASHTKAKFGFTQAVPDYRLVLDDNQVDAVFITTPHNLHASMVCDCLSAGKHTFVEKPLAMSLDELERVRRSAAEFPDRLLMIGFNRRFSPHTVAMKDWLRAAPSNKSVVITVNAGAIPSDHWTQDPSVGGGRIVGEACHFIDLARYLVDSPITDSKAFPIHGGDGRQGDCVTIQLSFADGSTATVHYLANGSKNFPKERIEVFAGGKVVTCDNFRRSREIGGKRKLKTRSQDKGHQAELRAFVSAIREGGEWPIPLKEMLEVSRVAIEMQTAAWS